MYGSLVAVGTLAAFVYMPETIGRSLETYVINVFSLHKFLT